MTTWNRFGGPYQAHIDHAYDILRRKLTAPDADPELAAWWKVLDEAACGTTLPASWDRLTALQIGEWLGMTASNWRTSVATGYAPSPDGDDGAGRSWWHPSTVEAYRSKTWEPTPAELARRPANGAVRPAGGMPPRSGSGSGVDAWARYLTSRGIDVPPNTSRNGLIALATSHGLTASA